MSEQQIEYSQLETGYEFPHSTFKLDAAAISAYLKAVEDTSYPYQDKNLVPPMAIAAFAMAALSRGINLPPGTIHVSQEFEFVDTANTNESLTSHARISRKLSRGKFNLLDVDLNVCNQEHKTVLTGKTSFILPQQDN